MSASPVPTAAVPSQKRPLEDPSSETGLNDQPEAKRPALDNVRDEEEDDGDAIKSEVNVKLEDTTDGAPEGAAMNAEDNAPSSAVKLENIKNDEIKHEILDTQPIQSTTHTNGASTSQGSFSATHQDESQWLHMRAVISSAEAATVIGKGGENVTLIRRMSGAKCTVSDYTRGAVERVLTVSGLVDAVAKVRLSTHLNHNTRA